MQLQAHMWSIVLQQGRNERTPFRVCRIAEGLPTQLPTVHHIYNICSSRTSLTYSTNCAINLPVVYTCSQGVLSSQLDQKFNGTSLERVLTALPNRRVTTLRLAVCVFTQSYRVLRYAVSFSRAYEHQSRKKSPPVPCSHLAPLAS